MALTLCNLQLRSSSSSSLPFQHRTKIIISPKLPSSHFNQTRTHHLQLFAPKAAAQQRLRHISPLKSALVNGYPTKEEGGGSSEEIELSEKLRNWVRFVRQVLPGGEWWKLSDEEVDVMFAAKPVTVLKALGKMWELIQEDRWVVFSAFVALIITALSEISIPHFLTASIFSAQSGEIALFHQNVRLLVSLCIIAGICSGVRGCLFGVANMIVVKRLRERLYSMLMIQDISFFDSETVGGLTSRLGSDCQQVSRVIGNDLNLILRNVLQGSGAMIYLLVLSLPLGLCVLAICIALSAIMLVYGQ